jgi:hypothetical protein
LPGLRERRKPLKGENPMSVTHPKMVGRWRKEKAAERLRKPASGAVAGGVGTASGLPGNRGACPGDWQDVDFLLRMRCRGTKPQERRHPWWQGARDIP